MKSPTTENLVTSVQKHHLHFFLWSLAVVFMIVVGWFVAQSFLGPFGIVFFPPVEGSWEKDDAFFIMVAEDFNVPQLCSKVSPNSIDSHMGLGTRGMEFVQSECYARMAYLTHDTTLCSHVRSLIAFGSGESGLISEKTCRNGYDNFGVANMNFGNVHSFDDIMMRLGYSQNDALASVQRNDPRFLDPGVYARYYPGEFNAFQQLYRYILNDKEGDIAKQTFLKRVESLSQ